MHHYEFEIKIKKHMQMK